jgi:propanol-preferring alcohol dehydrogenase
MMRAMVMVAPREPLRPVELAIPEPAPHEVLLRVQACGACRTDIHILEGEIEAPRLPLVLGHQIIGRVAAKGAQVSYFRAGDRVGVAWLGFACGLCRHCAAGRENLCEGARFTGFSADGGFAEYARADARFCYEIPEEYDDAAAAPLLCAGLIGFRSLRMAGDAERLGLYGFGSAAHIVAQVARHQGRRVFAFVRPGDEDARQLALETGAEWAGDSNEDAPEELDGAIIFAPVGDLVPRALGAVSRGGTVVCAGIHMSAIPSFPYELLWGERVLRSVANLTRLDGEEFLTIAPRVPVRCKVRTYPLAAANQALEDLRSGRLSGSAVLTP